MATDQEIRDAGFKFISQQKYLQNPFKLPVAPVGAPEGNEPFKPISNSFNNNNDGNDFNPAGNMFGEGTKVNPVYGGNPIKGGLGEAGTGVDPVTGDMVGGGNIVDEFGTDGNVYSETNFNNIKEEEEKKGFLSKMMNSFKQRTANLPDWAKKGITAAGMINPLTAIPSLISKFGSGSGGGGSYGIAGLDDRQKAMYDNLAASGYLYDTPGGMKTFDGKNFSQFDVETIDNYFDSKTDKFGSIEEYEDYLNEDPKLRKNLIKKLQFFKQAKKGDDTFTDFSNITDPNITSDMIDEFTTTNNNDGGSGTPPGFGITATGNYTNQFDGGDPGQGQGSNDHDGGASADAQSDDAAGMGGYARGGRAGYFFGGRVNYKKGGRVSFKNGGLASIL